MYEKYQLHPPYGFSENFLTFSSKIYPFCRPGNQSNSAIWTKAMLNVEDYSINMSVKINSKYTH